MSVKNQILNEFERLKLSPIRADTFTYAALLKKCSSTKDLSLAKLVHSQIAKHGCDCHTYIGNLVVEMYGKCSSLEDALAVFRNIRAPNVFSWNTILAACFQNGSFILAEKIFHAIPAPDLVSCNVMIATYAKNGHLEEAVVMFDKMPERDVVSWNSVLSAYIHNSDALHGEEVFEKMPQRNSWAWNTMIKSNAQAGHLERAKSTFDVMTEKNIVSWASMVFYYCQSEKLSDAKALFERMPQMDTVSINAMVFGYAQAGHVHEAKEVFDAVHDEQTVTCNTMISAFAKHGNFNEAMNLFNRMGSRDIVSWNVMLTGHAQFGHGMETLQLFRELNLDGFEPNAITMTVLFDACTSSAELAYGKLIYAHAIESGIQLNDASHTALLNLYAHCGSMAGAISVFQKLTAKDVVSWTAMITAFDCNGQTHQAIGIFRMMTHDGLQPNELTFRALLTACSHGGHIFDGIQFFKDDYGIVPTHDHFVCLIDLLGRIGQIEEAERLLISMPFEADVVAWRALLSACESHGDTMRGRRVAGMVLQLESPESALIVQNKH